MKRILIIEDDPAISRGLSDALTQEHFEVVTEEDGEKGFKFAQNENIALIILDLMLPAKNGIEICSDLRKKGINTPILMLTSKNEEMDKVLGLEVGADDYLTKPFSIRELLARVKALLRRNQEIVKYIEAYSFGSVYIDFKKQTALKNDKPVELSTTEFKIIKYFVEHEGEVVSRDNLLDKVWGYDVFPTSRTVDNYILSIRKQIEDNPSEPKHLITVPKAGYRFVK
ncbi:MAG: response regulator transcription factor [Ignavibacteriaceae bacterium]|nr:response regulator transcription factor [Ignavibacteriaceae bacterium]